MAKLSKEEIERMDFIIPGYKDFVEGRRPTVPNVEPLADFLDGIDPREYALQLKNPKRYAKEVYGDGLLVEDKK